MQTALYTQGVTDKFAVGRPRVGSLGPCREGLTENPTSQQTLKETFYLVR